QLGDAEVEPNRDRSQQPCQQISISRPSPSAVSPVHMARALKNSKQWFATIAEAVLPRPAASAAALAAAPSFAIIAEAVPPWSAASAAALAAAAGAAIIGGDMAGGGGRGGGPAAAPARPRRTAARSGGR